jgi:hypothetical protein
MAAGLSMLRQRKKQLPDIFAAQFAAQLGCATTISYS